MKPERARTWKDLVYEAIRSLPAEFTLRDLERFTPEFRAAYPENRFITAKVRQTLQILRDQGVLVFLGDGRYLYQGDRKKISLLLNPSVAQMYQSRSQVGRVVIQTWAELNLYCLSCDADQLLPEPENTQVVDMACARCGRQYQIKSKQGLFEGRITGAAYGPVLRAVQEGRMPDYVLVEHSRRRATVVGVRAYPGALLTPERVLERKPLAGTAKRAGWIGCTIDVEGVPYVEIVGPQAAEPRDARERWSKLARR
ncbi:MAG TPA: DpnI domain-containing protein [Solirubrobacteraceae bacterium]|nr:DpnI domain-containing protein [Solirubrobacteraceae bacterium]